MNTLCSENPIYGHFDEAAGSFVMTAEPPRKWWNLHCSAINHEGPEMYAEVAHINDGPTRIRDADGTTVLLVGYDQKYHYIRDDQCGTDDDLDPDESVVGWTINGVPVSSGSLRTVSHLNDSIVGGFDYNDVVVCSVSARDTELHAFAAKPCCQRVSGVVWFVTANWTAVNGIDDHGNIVLAKQVGTVFCIVTSKDDQLYVLLNRKRDG